MLAYFSSIDKKVTPSSRAYLMDEGTSATFELRRTESSRSITASGDVRTSVRKLASSQMR